MDEGAAMESARHGACVHAGGKLYGGVKDVMASTGMLAKSVALAEAVRAAGGKVFHVPIMFKPDGSDNPNKGLGILAGCYQVSEQPRWQLRVAPARQRRSR